MKRILYLIIAISAPLIVSSSALAIPYQAVASRPGFMVRSDHRALKLSGLNSFASENWSGYAATGNNGSFTSVSSTWVQPALNCAALPKINSYSAYWVGLDGFSDQTVEQIGTEANCINDTASYSAWFEMYPQNPYEVPFGMSIAPGNSITASVKYNPAAYTVIRGRQRLLSYASYSLTLTNNSTNKSYTAKITSRYNYGRSSAEVITEAPYSNGTLPLSDFGVVNYTNSLANNLPLGIFANLQEIVMDNPAGMISTPSPFDSTNKNFNVTWSD
jgi:hypothetical protein